MSAMSAIENMSEIIQREVEATLQRFRDGIFTAVKEDHPEVDQDEYELQLEKFAKNTVKKIFATKEFKSLEKKLSPAKKEKRDPDAPKAAKNAFILFCGENRDSVKKENSDLKPTEITKKLGEMWRELDDEDKEEYQNKAKEDKERFENEMEDYEPKDGFRCPKKSPKKDKSPKRARSAYIFFCGEKREEVTKKLVKDGKKKTDVMKKLGEMWRDLDDKEKKPYEKMAKEDKKRFEKEMKNFEPESEEEDEDEEEEIEEKKSSTKKSKVVKKDSEEESSSKKSKKSKDSNDKKSKKSKVVKNSDDDDEDENDEDEDQKSKKSTKKAKATRKSKSSSSDDELLSE